MAITTISKTTLDPGYRRLGAAIVLQAAKDLQAPDPVESLDALLWLLYGGSDFLLEALEINAGGLDLLRTVQVKKGGDKNGWKRNRLTRAAG